MNKIKGLAPILAVITVSLLIVGAIGGYMLITHEPSQNIIQSQQVIQTNQKVSVLDEGSPVTMTVGDRPEIFTINCDNDHAYGLIDHVYYCDITNNHKDTQVVTISTLLSNQAKTKMGEVYYSDTCSETECDWIDEGSMQDTYDNNSKVNGTEWVPNYVCHEETTYFDCWKNINIGAPTTTEEKNYTTTGTVSIPSGVTQDIKIVMQSPIGYDGKFNIFVDSKDGSGLLDPWYSSSYTKRINFTIDNSNSTIDLVNMPVLVHINSSRVTLADLQADYEDIRFTNEAGLTEFDFEMEYFNSTDFWVWVKIPNITAGSSDDYFYMYYNNPTATDGQDRVNTWSNNYSLVLHMNDDNFMDSTGNNANLTGTRASIIPNGTIGNMLYVQEQAGETCGYIVAAHDTDLYGMESVNMIFSVTGGFSSADTDHEYLWYKRTAAITGGLAQFKHESGKIRISTATASGEPSFTLDTDTDTWAEGENFFTYNYETANNTMYINGSYDGTVADADTFPDNSHDLTIGSRDAGATDCFSGTIDEFRWSEESRSPDWIYAQTLSQNDTYLTYGFEEDIPNITVNNQTYSPNPVEVTTTYHDLNITYQNYVTFTAELWADGTQYAATYTTNTSPTEWYFNTTMIYDLAASDGESQSIFWNLTSDDGLGNITYNHTTSAVTQNVQWDYYFDTPVGSAASGVEGTNFQWNSTLRTGAGAVVISNKTAILNNTVYTPTVSGTTHYTTQALPTVEVLKNIEYWYSLHATYNGETVNRSSAHGSVAVSPVQITNCSIGTSVLQYRYRDEERPYDQVNASMDMTITWWTSDSTVNKSQNFTFPANTSADGLHEVCIYPVTSEISAYSIQEYWNDTGDADGSEYPSRNYYLYDASLSNVSQNITLYTLNSTVASTVGISVQDTFSDAVDDVIVKIQRYYIGEDTYRTVAMSQTDDEGDSVTRLRLSSGDDDVFYRFILERYGVVLKTVEDTKVIQTSLLFTVSLESLSEYYEYYDNLGYSCEYNNATQLLSCEWSDTSGLMAQARLRVEQLMLIGYADMCDSTSTSTAGVLTCDLTGMTDEVYQFWLEFTFADTVYTAVSGIISNTQSQLYGENGVMAAFIFVLILGFIGLFSPEVAIILSLIGIIASFMAGLVTVGLGAIFALIIAAALLIYKVGN